MSAVELAAGQDLPELVKHPTTRQLVQYAGAQGDFYEIHYDLEYAQSVGLPGVILHGLLKAGFLAQLVTDWLGDRGRLITFEVWGEDEAGKRTTVGMATVRLD